MSQASGPNKVSQAETRPGASTPLASLSTIKARHGRAAATARQGPQGGHVTGTIVPVLDEEDKKDDQVRSARLHSGCPVLLDPPMPCLWNCAVSFLDLSVTGHLMLH